MSTENGNGHLEIPDHILSGIPKQTNMSRVNVEEYSPPPKPPKEGDIIRSTAADYGDFIEDVVTAQLFGNTADISDYSDLAGAHSSVINDLRPGFKTRHSNSSKLLPAYGDTSILDRICNPRRPDVNIMLGGIDTLVPAHLRSEFGKFGGIWQGIIEPKNGDSLLATYSDVKLQILQTMPLNAAAAIGQVSRRKNKLLADLCLNPDLVKTCVIPNVHIVVNGKVHAQLDGVIVSDPYSTETKWLTEHEQNSGLTSYKTWWVIEMKFMTSARIISGERGLREPLLGHKRDLKQKLGSAAVALAESGQDISFPDGTAFVYIKGINDTQVLWITMDSNYYYQWYLDLVDLECQVENTWSRYPAGREELTRLKTLMGLVYEEAEYRQIMEES